MKGAWNWALPENPAETVQARINRWMSWLHVIYELDTSLSRMFAMTAIITDPLLPDLYFYPLNY